jgi:hypothetical protein
LELITTSLIEILIGTWRTPTGKNGSQNWKALASLIPAWIAGSGVLHFANFGECGHEEEARRELRDLQEVENVPL